MNKRIKRIIVITLALTVFSAASPGTYLRLFDSRIAYASSDDEDDEYKAIENSYLSDLSISEGTLHFSKKKTDYTVKVDRSNESVVVTATAKNSSDKIKINGATVSLDSGNRAKKTIELEKGRNLIKIKVETEAYGIRTYNLVINRGSASSSSNDSNLDGVHLNSIKLSDGSIDFSRDKMVYDVNVGMSTNQIRITAEPEDNNYEVKIAGVKVDEDESYRRTLKLINGKNTFLINLEDNDGNEQTYTLNIYKTTAIDNSEALDNIQDPIYLDDIVIEDGDILINFKPKLTSYAVDVKDSYDSIVIKAEPENDDLVIINGSKCQNSYVRRVNLNEGKNVIQIQVNNNNTYDQSDDEYEERTYTLTVYRGASEGTAQGANNSSLTSNAKINQWVNNSGKWQYYDSMGNALKGTWYTDKNNGKRYYLQEDSNMATGWLYNNNSWYYLDESGAMQIGWKRYGTSWYYLYKSGIMATNTIIDGYKIGTDGAWIS